MTNFFTKKTFFYFLFITLTVSCKGNKDEDNAKQETHIIVRPTVNKEQFMGASKPLLASNTGQQNIATENPAQEVQYLGDLDAIISSPNESTSPLSSSRKEPIAQAGKLLAATNATSSNSSQPMSAGTRFRLVIMKGNLIVLNEVYSVGQRIDVALDGQQTYTWFALSFENTSTNIPMPNSAGVIARTALENQNFLFAKGTLEAKTGVNYLNLSFKRLTARIRVKLDVRGLFGRINNSTTLSIIKNASNESAAKSGDFNIFTGKYTNIQNSKALTAEAMFIDPTGPNGAVKIGDFYTIDTADVAAGNLKLKLNEINITLDDGRTRSFRNGNSITYKNAYKPKFGNHYELNTRLIEAAVKVKNIYWSRSNIVYNSAYTDSYRLKSNPGGSTSANGDTEFWNWMVNTPNAINYGQVDPCTRIYPAGVWRMPTRNEWAAIGQPDRKEEILGFIFGAQYAYIWNRDANFPANNSYDDNNLFLSFGGYRDSWGRVQQTPIGLGLGLLAVGQCHYWTSSTSAGQPIGVQAAFRRLIWGFSWGDVTYPTSSTDNGKNIRCVRNIINN